MPNVYAAYDVDTGRKVDTIANVADAVKLVGVVTTNGSPDISFTSNDKLLPGMLVVLAGVPAGTRILTVNTLTTATLRADATADGAGLIAHCFGYIPDIVTVEYPLGTFRDDWDNSTDMTIMTAEGDNCGVISMRGVGVTPVNPTVTAPTGGGVNGQPVCVAVESLTVTQADPVNHTAPRELKEKWGVVIFILADGQEVPKPARPNLRYGPVE